MNALMVDLKGTELQAEERDLIEHPAVGGVIVFSRNYQDRKQIQALTTALRNIKPNLLIAVDQEGGRVQRLLQDFTPLPAVRTLGHLYDEDPKKGLEASFRYGQIMAGELAAVGFDFSFAPVLDLDHGLSQVIGDRSFHTTPEGVVALAGAWIRGAKTAGMRSIGKHFPGHGFAQADSHTELPMDTRDFEDILNQDIQIFKSLATELAGVMTAHIVYSACDPKPATFSKFWLQEVLRQRLCFSGMVFSDDLSMQGAAVYASLQDRVFSAREAGCDMVLICNHREAVYQVLDEYQSCLL